MVARLRLTRTLPVAAILLVLLLVVAWQRGMLNPYYWMGAGSSSDTILLTEETLFATFPLVVEGTLVAKGQGETEPRGDNPRGIPYDLYELRVTQVWSGPQDANNLPLAFQKNTAGFGVDSTSNVKAGEKYVFFLPLEPRQGGVWEGMYPLGGSDQLIWRPVGDRIVPTVPHFEEMTRAGFAAFIEAELAKQQYPDTLVEDGT